jgi:hypothetical protein
MLRVPLITLASIAGDAALQEAIATGAAAIQSREEKIRRDNKGNFKP